MIYYLYMMLFPDGHFYFGSSNQRSNNRKHAHNTSFKRGLNKKKLQEQFDKQGYPEFIVLGEGDEYDIKCSEYHFVDIFWNDPKLLNVNKPGKPNIQRIRIKQGSEQAIKQYKLDYRRAWNKTEAGKISNNISEAKRNIKKYTALNKLDLVNKWNKVLEKLDKKRVGNNTKVYIKKEGKALFFNMRTRENTDI